MFIIEQAPAEYTDPWNLPFIERMQTLNIGNRKVAYFYESANNSTFRYRAYNMAQVLNAGDIQDVSASYFFLEDWQYFDLIADTADLLVICRSRYNHKINQLITKFKVRNKRVLFDIDDFVFNTRFAHLVINTLDQDAEKPEVWDDWFASIGRLGETLRFCDGAITTNSSLAARIHEFTGQPVSIVPNFINNEQLTLSDKIFASKKSLNFARNDRITLGYFSGSPSHNLDYALVTSALAEVMESDPRIDLLLVGYIDAGEALKGFGSRIMRYPFHDYVNLQRLIASVEFNLMPLQTNVFTNCKSELKYFESAIVGTLSIASPTFTYGNAIQDKVNGYIAQSHQWVSSIRYAISNIDAYDEMATVAYNDARNKYAWLYQRQTILAALGID
ncbi:hypothetical protein [Aquirhabdus sp.]|uniref:hypothetical protein n=1 Tax=Aquirhabdus sp. TaxID=2824160 RepID=UPI00396CEFB6